MSKSYRNGAADRTVSTRKRAGRREYKAKHGSSRKHLRTLRCLGWHRLTFELCLAAEALNRAYLAAESEQECYEVLCGADPDALCNVARWHKVPFETSPERLTARRWPGGQYARADRLCFA